MANVTGDTVKILYGPTVTRRERDIPFWLRQPKEGAVLWEVDTIYSEVDSLGGYKCSIWVFVFYVYRCLCSMSIIGPILVKRVKRDSRESD